MMPPVRKNSALFLDIDGTLLDMARTPDAVVVPPNSAWRWFVCMTGWTARWPLSAAARLRASTACSRRCAPPPIGCHGAEVRGAGRQCPRAGRSHARSGARTVSRAGGRHIPARLLEDKIYALALHYRLAPEARAGRWRRRWKSTPALFAAEKVAILHGKAVIDAKPLGVDKGVGRARPDAPERLSGAACLCSAATTPPIMDVFHILPRTGRARLFGGPALSPAWIMMFDSPHAVRQWLSRLAERGIAA